MTGTSEDAGRPRAPREPIRRPWVWIVTAVLIVGGVPWYWPPGTVHPLVLGVPLWALVSMAFTVALAAHLSHVCRTQWAMADEDEGEGGA
ncbi:hypothetical protein O4J56_07485 [Nocardiopsis sp. RSe5-2]|uniref:DUF3311 domain-containing protein n=1 Tax=Nocardiopsis endophytica TaxID=3018445 RepID=A0ABT4U0J7_9ACTN|nr:hypothetical protein [Nocardiopsis endophytica]MDA2810475.1 hypothetical protein [Nocardiopsis endophytica]